ncbi:phenylpyruvate tautomerase MIF-related protein [Imhoffiella purpurea]|uniref:L-dopachrome isomerase n=1 Tax=Imhoffiella purpurea TaxID=1249627 RepID=W9V7B8_9GAMM|nr:phenylpyruvate tautomerase MIF-related protein [Imhoffiella purpurea]EXJ15453.1 macrophage migration inhibitory factor family protein [Imhoffiella purpurea]
MPTLRILTNVSVQPDVRQSLLARASSAVAEMLGKPESYVMVVLEDGRDIIFGGSFDPTAYLELKSLGLPEDRTPDFSKTLCALVSDLLSVPPGRVYIEFASPPRHLFGWNSGTF